MDLKKKTECDVYMNTAFSLPLNFDKITQNPKSQYRPWPDEYNGKLQELIMAR